VAGNSAVSAGTTHPRGFGAADFIRWPLVPCRDLFELKYGKALVASSRRPGRVPVYGTNGQCGTHDTALFQGPGVILGRKGQGPLGVEWCSRDYWVIDTAYSLVPRTDTVDLKYAYFLFKYIGLNHLKDGTSNPSLSRDTFGAQAIPMPSLKEQRSVVQVLSTLDDKIELNRKMNETLEEMARALFKSWFVDFDPVRAKAEGRQPYGMDAETAALFPDSFQDSPLGKIPKGWNVCPIGEVVQCLGGGTPRTKESKYWVGGMNPFVTPRDMSSLACPVLLDSERHITDEGVAKISSGRLPAGTVLLSSRAPIGYLAIAEQSVSVNQGIIAMVCDGSLPNHYVLHWTRENMDAVEANAGGTTFAEISKKNFRPIPAIVPLETVSAAFTQQAGSLHERMVSNVKESNTLAEIRDALLPKLLSGEVRV